MSRTRREFRILVVNTGSTSTKVSYFRNDRTESSAKIIHTLADLDNFKTVWSQYDYRLKTITEWVNELKSELSAVVGVGGLFRSIVGGTYVVNEKMIRDARANLQGEHPSNLGCAIAFSIAQMHHCPAYVVDPVSVDEFEDVARYSGLPSIERKSLSHALSIHAVSRIAAKRIKKPISKTSFIVAHLGGGISVAPVLGGRIIDANDASSDGPFSPERSGGLPLQQFIELCFSGEFSKQEVSRMVMGKGGLRAYLGTNSAREVEGRIQKNDLKAEMVYRAMAYQISKEIGAMSAVLKGKVDRIILAGGLAGSTLLTKWIRDQTSWIAPVETYAGDDEMKSMAVGALRVLRGEDKPKEY